MKELNENELSMVNGGAEITLDEARFITNSLIESADHTFVYKNMKFELTTPNEYFVVGDMISELILGIKNGAALVDFGPNTSRYSNDTWKLSENSIEKKVHSLKINISVVK